MKKSVALILCLVPASAFSYCIENQLRDREVTVEQEFHKDRLREGRTLKATLAPGKRHCCRNLDCVPDGRSESLVNLTVKVLGEPVYTCGHAEGATFLKVTGDGTVRVQHNPRHPKHSAPYIVRIRSGQKDLTGPTGLYCAPPPPPRETVRELREKAKQ